ncbi:hypothetical protein AX16_002885 [Volvariella volvacea WC 439]|nr:hypothetical protein AX16_002885 [Volvariella volvacea WC 439]
MSVIARLPGPLSATLVLYGLYRLARFYYKDRTSPLRVLPGPKSWNWIWGNLQELVEIENGDQPDKWVKEYGNVIICKGFLGTSRLFVADPKALNHILMNSYTYQKPEQARFMLSEIVGNGLLVTEEDKHKQQRKIMNPAFGAAQIRELTEIFVEKSIQLRDIWEGESIKQGGVATIDVLSWLSRMTLDVIGLAGFNYHFDNLRPNSKPNELNEAFAVLLNPSKGLQLLPLLRGLFPALRFLPTDRSVETRQARQTMMRIGNQLLQESKNAVADNKGSLDEKNRRRDLLSLLVRANMSTELPESQRMKDEDVLAQVPTFLAAGHETTSTATTWALYALCCNPRVQSKLREELLSISTDNPTMDTLNSLPYLDAVVRETLRVHAPVPTTVRTTVREDVLPLGTPFEDPQGVLRDSITVPKGQVIFLPIFAINRAKEIWGEDALEFRPERWESLPEATSSVPGMWGNQLTFLGGPRACIGYRFSLVEMKALLFTLVRAFEFELAVPASDIMKKTSMVQRPLLKSDPKGKSQLPLLVKLYSPAA